MDLSSNTLTAFDAAVLIIVGLSTLFAFGRGFATVALSFGAWAGALLATVFGFELAKSYGRDIISPPELADLITLAVIFFVTLFVLKQIAEFIGGMVKDSPVGLLDRSLGALFGLLRGVVIVSVIYLGFDKLFPSSSQPEWIKEARLKPLVAWSAGMIEGFASEAMGKDPTGVGSDYLQKAADSVPSQFINEKLEEQAAKYIEEQRDQLDDLVGELAKEKKKNDGN
ncbi:CvpA family protein [Kordiimonas sp.]|uniref:CvpA family protein n=1 Tax=Kordiimonas sp. TaxID=1970157 RepID=UPI003A92570C